MIVAIRPSSPKGRARDAPANGLHRRTRPTPAGKAPERAANGRVVVDHGPTHHDREVTSVAAVLDCGTDRHCEGPGGRSEQVARHGVAELRMVIDERRQPTDLHRCQLMGGHDDLARVDGTAVARQLTEGIRDRIDEARGLGATIECLEHGPNGFQPDPHGGAVIPEEPAVTIDPGDRPAVADGKRDRPGPGHEHVPVRR